MDPKTARTLRTQPEFLGPLHPGPYLLQSFIFCAAPERCGLPGRYVTYPGEEVQVAAQYYIAQTGLRKCGHPVCYYHYLHYRVQERLANPKSIDAR